jgi:hypothetical protein
MLSSGARGERGLLLNFLVMFHSGICMNASHKKCALQALCALRLKDFCSQLAEQKEFSLLCTWAGSGDFLANPNERFVPHRPLHHWLPHGTNHCTN